MIDTISNAMGKRSRMMDPRQQAVGKAVTDYSAKRAAHGEDIGQPGKNFQKIVDKSGGGEKGKRIAGAILAHLRAKGGG
jgi:hypothetical protein